MDGSGSGGIGACYSGILNIDSSILFNNVEFQVNGATSVTYSDVQGGVTGTGNISGNPLFLDSAYHLVEGVSPCIDVGNPDASHDDGCLPPGLGQARNDMGAYGGPLGCNW
jgi:hypothetical protein